MTATHQELGDLRRVGATLEGRLERRIEHDQQTVWTLLTAPERLAEWLAPGTIELRLGGAAKLNFTGSGTVIGSYARYSRGFAPGFDL